ncbi:MAG TPA: OmpA family protein [Kofleriaceae bacterium]|nr:OmpA family protein [Kofleriaceae bacterium]
MRTLWLAVAAVAALATPAAAEVKTTNPPAVGEVYFKFDSARVDGATQAIDKIVTFAEANPNLTIVLDGYADPQGPAPYNVALAARRAEGLRSRLVARGVEADRIVIVTYGEDGPRHAAYRLDRRVTAWGTDAPLYAIIERSLKRGTAVLWNKPVEETALYAPKPEHVARK